MGRSAGDAAAATRSGLPARCARTNPRAPRPHALGPWHWGRAPTPNATKLARSETGDACEGWRAAVRPEVEPRWSVRRDRSKQEQRPVLILLRGDGPKKKMRMARLELARPKPHAPQTCVSTNSTTSAWSTSPLGCCRGQIIPGGVFAPRQLRSALIRSGVRPEHAAGCPSAKC